MNTTPIIKPINITTRSLGFDSIITLPFINVRRSAINKTPSAKNRTIKFITDFSAGLQTKTGAVSPSFIVIVWPVVKVALKSWAPVDEVNRSVEVLTFLIVLPSSNPMKSARASKVAFVFVKLDPSEVRL